MAAALTAPSTVASISYVGFEKLTMPIPKSPVQQELCVLVGYHFQQTLPDRRVVIDLAGRLRRPRNR
ncbi:hypothetical protein [Nocardia sp. NPDC052112]|uniref:hypothetical protein n=1 Tax=Nocardia sp. NPDC052112 TaxID=3155646 RepID=UPI0034192A64